ncbi:hypothetical protein N7474_006597 [Penicillium riverlandense]|uniref:uncharacterized protein n=1 Tax=Penicillium riverlandense TaxID=1903569 RepID=UPI002547BA83|nr:uncharacterized protein N7474_006597 [Penicillium riverlandense]KAJ5814820.1 hypothetical protein N7474_006597 [Penicillium riverlandense]
MSHAPRGGSQASMPIRGGNDGGQRASGPTTGEVKNPDSKVTQLEDQTVKQMQDLVSNGLAYRPGYGTQGRSIVLRANFFEVEFKPNVEYFFYSVSIRPEGAPRGQIREVFEKLMQLPPVLSCNAASDRASEIVACGKLPTVPVDIKIGDEPSRPRKVFTVTLRENGVVRPSELLSSLRQTDPREEYSLELIAVRSLNLLMGRHPSQDPGVATIGRGRTRWFWIDSRMTAADLRGGLQVVRGYFSSMRLAGGRALLNLNVNHGAFYKEMPFINFILEFESTFGRDRSLFNRYIRGLRVHATHLQRTPTKSGKKRPRYKSIWALASPSDARDAKDKDGRRLKYPPQVPRLGSCANNVKFYEDTHEQYISVADYFKRTYNIVLKYADRPVVNVGSKDRPIYLPAEVSAGGLRKTTSQLTDGLDMMGINNGTMQVGMKFHKEMITVYGRILNPPSLKYGASKVPPRNGSWNLVGKKFCQGASLKNWTCIWVKKEGCRDAFQSGNPSNALNAFQQKMNELGMRVGPPVVPGPTITIKVKEEDKSINMKDFMEQTQKVFRALLAKDYRFVVVLLPTPEDRIFDYIKWIGETRAGVLTHCVLADKFALSNGQYLANNAMKVNLKLGGVNQTLDSSSQSPLIVSGKTMIVGLDVTHPSTTDPESFPSIATIVASTDGRLGQWPGEVRIQERRRENLQFLKNMMISRLEMWQKSNNGQLPKNIIVYRDGVSEGQYPMVLTEELPLVKHATQSMYKPDELPNITIIVVGKRHNVRFYPTTEGDQDKTQNPINGTVVDRGVTRPRDWDFYLQAQAPLQGSARPAHYFVIHDEIFTNRDVSKESRPADSLESLTHNICYVMGRCTRSISYSTPAFLADKFCDRARKYVRAYYTDKEISTGQDRFSLPPPGESEVRLASGARESMVYI